MDRRSFVKAVLGAGGAVVAAMVLPQAAEAAMPVPLAAGPDAVLPRPTADYKPAQDGAPTPEQAQYYYVRRRRRRPWRRRRRVYVYRPIRRRRRYRRVYVW